jgi:hypothetical protein
MWEYSSYALFVVLIIGGLRYVMSGLEPEVPPTKRPDLQQNP